MTLRVRDLCAALATALLAGTALAQQAAPPGSSPGPVPAPAVVNGHDGQPRTDIPGGQTDPEAADLLRETHDSGPIVPPHDLYGNPLGVDTQHITGKKTHTTTTTTSNSTTTQPH